MNSGLLIIRVMIGGLLVGHGTQKLFGWFGGGGLEGTSRFFRSVGYRKPRAMAALAGFSEAAGGAMIAIGFATPLAAAAIIGVMMNAIVAVHLPKGPWNPNGGYEYPLVLATVSWGLAWAGAGRYSVDGLLGWHPNGALAALASLVLGVVAAFVILETRDMPEAQLPASESARRSRAA